MFQYQVSKFLGGVDYLSSACSNHIVMARENSSEEKLEDAF